MTSQTAIASLAEPIGRKAISELVAQRILDLVRLGHLGPGDRLPPERELAIQLNISRPTVREAMRALSILGVLEIRHGDGVYVSSLDAAELLNPLDFFVSMNIQNLAELFDARISYEPIIAGLAADRLDDAALEHLQDLVDTQLAHPENAELFHNTDAEFHKTIVEASGNIFLSRVGKLFQVLSENGRKTLQAGSPWRQSIEDHTVIMSALHARDSAAAQAAMPSTHGQRPQRIAGGLGRLTTARPKSGAVRENHKTSKRFWGRTSDHRFAPVGQGGSTVMVEDGAAAKVAVDAVRSEPVSARIP